MITKVSIKNFRNFKDIDLELKPLNVLIGPNGTGKTNFLYSFFIFRAGLDDSLATVVGNLGGFKGMSSNFLSDNRITIDIDISFEPTRKKFLNIGEGLTSKDFFNYELFFEEDLFGFKFGEELFKNNQKVLSKNGQENFVIENNKEYKLVYNENASQSINEILNELYYTNHFELALSQINFPPFVNITNFLKKFRFYKTFDLKPDSQIRKVQLVKNTYKLDRNGYNLLNVLHTICSNDTDAWDKIESVLKASFYNFERLIFSPSTGDGQLDLKWKFKNSKEAVSAYFLSDGQLKLLCLLAILYSPIQDEVVFIDEPETHLHPTLLKIVGDVFKEVSERKQLIIATHSPDLLNKLELEDILTLNFNRENGSTDIERLSSREDLDGWLEDYKLGDLMRMKEIGSGV